MRGLSVDVIVPVYGAAAQLERCLTSLGDERERVLLVVDGPQHVDVERVLERFPSASILRNDRRLGFVRIVNRGMRATTNDVVLLNSDTIVTPRWLEKLSAAAASSPNVGTVTPFSNHATLCSIPRAFEENLLPHGFDVTSFGALVERVSTRAYPRLPTGVGFCLYIRRALLDDLGFFDEEHFGHGYGEENDFCLRATKRGWTHLLDDATFVYHEGGRSFGAEAKTHLRRGSAALQRLHPDYLPTIARFMKDNPLAPVRQRILHALGTRKREAPRIAHLVHGWPPFARGGTELYAQGLVREQLREHEVSVYARIADPARANGEAVELNYLGARVRLVTNNFLRRDPLSRNALRDRALERDFARFLRDQRPHLLHIHHLGGHAFSLARVARGFGIRIVQSLHDWWPLCARVNLFDANGQRCSGPSLMKCARCAPLTRVPFANVPLHALRRRDARAALAHADAFVMGSQAIRRDFIDILPRGVPLHVVEYGVDVEQRAEPKPTAHLPVRFGCVGAVLPHKGLHLADAAFAGIDPHHATLHIWGNANADPAYAATLRHAKLEGTFEEEEKERVFDSLDVLLMPSIGLESFGLVAREAMARGVPVLAARDGALSELFADGRGGMHFRAGDVTSLHDAIVTLIEEPWSRREMPPVKSVAAHAEEIAAIYAAVLR
jgi:GT2 family glycosyltransferase/glycosyltransferase involved in cell wall biosynthesis